MHHLLILTQGRGRPESCYFFLSVIVPSTISENVIETLKGCGLADDISLFPKATHQNLINVELILKFFLELSYLAVNWGKTAVVPSSVPGFYLCNYQQGSTRISQG